jgi:oligopeptide transport system ATP-binding protein
LQMTLIVASSSHIHGGGKTIKMTDALLEVKNLSVKFPILGGLFQKEIGAVHAVSDVSLSVNKGETLGVVGESGCGKTTLGRAIVRLYEPNEGQIIFRGEDISRKSRSELRPIRRHMQMIFQDPYASLNPRMNIRAIIDEPMRLVGDVPKGERLERVVELLELVGLRSDALNRYPHEFSGGQRQRIGIARAIALKPDLIVADEAVSALDVSIQAQVINLLVDLQKKLGMAYLFIAHDLGVVRYLCDRVAVMYLGRIVEVGNAKDIYSRPLHPYTKALLSAIPASHPRFRRDVQPLAGDVPSPANPPQGCAFHPRCPAATDLCRRSVPELSELAGVKVACHLAKQMNQGEGR